MHFYPIPIPHLLGNSVLGRREDGENEITLIQRLEDWNILCFIYCPACFLVTIGASIWGDEDICLLFFLSYFFLLKVSEVKF